MQTTTEAPPLLLSVRDAARMLAISDRTLFTLTRAGEVPAIKVGGRSVRYAVDDLRAYVERRRQLRGE